MTRRQWWIAAAVVAEPLWVDTGVEQLVIPIASADAVRAARPDPQLLEQWGYSAMRKEAMAYLWAPHGPGKALVRFFFTANGAVLEDPATGSACANLGGWHLATGAPPTISRRWAGGCSMSGNAPRATRRPQKACSRRCGLGLTAARPRATSAPRAWRQPAKPEPGSAL